MRIPAPVHATLTLLACLFGTWPALAPAAPQELAFDDAWIRLTPGGAPMAGYLTITNAGQASGRVVAARSDAFARVTLHRSIVAGGRSRMQHVDGVTIPPGTQTTFEPGGLHLMLIGPRRELQVGETIELTLEVASGAQYRIAFEVRAIGAGS